jgi:hypothetical protein
MKTIRNIILILGVCLLCSKAVGPHLQALQSAAASDRRTLTGDGTVQNFFDAPVGSGHNRSSL